MELTPRRQALIDAHVADTHKAMLDMAFELNDLVRFAIAASRDKGNAVYYPMDPVNDGIRNWQALARKVSALSARVDREVRRLGVPPFDAEAPAEHDPAG